MLSFSLLLLTLSCKSTESSGPHDPPSIPDIQFIPKQTDSTAAGLPAAVAPDALPNTKTAALVATESAVDCKPEDAPVCPYEEPNSPYRCVTLKYRGALLPDSEQINSWANSPCQARLELYKASCAKHLNFAEIDQIACHPDANEGTCPAIFKDCPSSEAPTRCFAENLGDQELNWANRPEAWGNNECDARNKLKRKACSLGLDPKDMKEVSCEAEPSPAICPPVWKNCAGQDNDVTECKAAKVGELALKQPLSAIGANHCEATYRLQELVCRFQKDGITDFGVMQCRSLNKEKAAGPSQTIDAPAVDTAPQAY